MSDDLILIANCSRTRAEIIKLKLLERGVESILKNVNLISPIIGQGIQVYVSQNDLELALDLVAELEVLHGKERIEQADVVEDVDKILVPVDFTEYSYDACLFALGIAEKLHSEVMLVHVYYFPIVSSLDAVDGFSYQIDMNDTIGDISRKAQDSILNLYEHLNDYIQKQNYQHTKLEYALLNGDPISEVVRFAKSYAPGLLVMGTRGLGMNDRKKIGSITAEITEHVKIPVLTIPEVAKFYENSSLKIVYATDFDQSDYVALKKLMTLFYPYELEIFLLHISKKFNSLEEVKLSALKKHFEKYYSGFKVNAHLIEGKNIMQSIENFIADNEIDMIAMTTHKRNFIKQLLFPSMTTDMLYQSKIPVLAFHAS